MARRSKVEHYYHVVWATGDRAPLIATEIEPSVYRYITAEVTTLGGFVVAIGGMPDHVHVLVQLPARVCVPDLAQRAKGASSRIINENRLTPCRFKWQANYGYFSISRSHVKRVAAYIANQKAHHANGTTWKDWEETDEESDDVQAISR